MNSIPPSTTARPPNAACFLPAPLVFGGAFVVAAGGWPPVVVAPTLTPVFVPVLACVMRVLAVVVPAVAVEAADEAWLLIAELTEAW